MIGFVPNIVPRNGATMWSSCVLRDTHQASTYNLPLNFAKPMKFSFIFSSSSSSGTKHKLFDTTPKGFIPLAPGFWELHNWKAAVFMHHGVDILEQVSYHCFILHYLFFCIMCIHVFFLGFCGTARGIRNWRSSQLGHGEWGRTRTFSWAGTWGRQRSRPFGYGVLYLLYKHKTQKETNKEINQLIKKIKNKK